MPEKKGNFVEKWDVGIVQLLLDSQQKVESTQFYECEVRDPFSHASQFRLRDGPIPNIAPFS